MVYLLDTTALVAHHLRESGEGIVHELLYNQDVACGVSILSFYELDLMLHTLGFDDSFRSEQLRDYRNLLSFVTDVTETIRHEAIRLRILSSTRIPTVDSLIAASASAHNAILAHRDAHFAGIPETLLKQHLLPPK